MTEDEEQQGGEEVRSPLQVFIRVLLALLVVAVLVGLILAVVLRPERTLDDARPSQTEWVVTG